MGTALFFEFFVSVTRIYVSSATTCIYNQLTLQNFIITRNIFDYLRFLQTQKFLFADLQRK